MNVFLQLLIEIVRIVEVVTPEQVAALHVVTNFALGNQVLPSGPGFFFLVVLYFVLFKVI